MAKKKKEAAEPFEGISIETTAVVTQLTIKKNEDDIAFTALDFKDEGDKVLRELIKEASPVAVIIDLPTPNPDFPLIRAWCKREDHRRKFDEFVNLLGRRS